VLEEEKWEPVVEIVKEKLLTPVGLRTLAPGEKDYKPKYYGDLRARDAAYHQGTVWPWLLGPFIDAWFKVHPGDTEAVSQFLSAFDKHLSEGAMGSVSEIFDAETPYTAVDFSRPAAIVLGGEAEGLSATWRKVIWASSREKAMPVTTSCSMISSSSQMSVPS